VFVVQYMTIDKQSDAELVATVLGRKSTDVAVTRLATAISIEGSVGFPLEEVVREYGTVGPRSIARIEAAVELGRRALAAQAARQAETISTPEDVVRVVGPMLAARDREHFVALALNTKNALIKVIEVSVGSLNASIVHPRELFKEAVKVSAASIVVAHNHPSGDPSPSGADIQLTRRLVKAGDVLGVEVLDHVVIGGDRHASLRDLGLM